MEENASRYVVLLNPVSREWSTQVALRSSGNPQGKLAAPVPRLEPLILCKAFRERRDLRCIHLTFYNRESFVGKSTEIG